LTSIDRLLSNYARQVKLPWVPHLAGKQRVWFAVYPPSEERRIRAHLPQFEATTQESNHPWSVADLTPVLPKFLGEHRYREQIFQAPKHFNERAKIETIAAELISTACRAENAGGDSVVAVIGLASLFDIIRVSNLVERVEDSVRGRLLIFFPGGLSGTTYRFMDARDGFNYMAVPITSEESFIQS
jgi:hypothetical protein